MRPYEVDQSRGIARIARLPAQWQIGFCATLVAAVFLISLAGIRFVTVDDIWIAVWTWAGQAFESGYSLAVQHGRLFKPSSVALFVPYLIDHPFYYLCTYFGPIVLAAILAGKLLGRAVPIAGIGAFFALLFFAFAQNSSEHNLFSAVPFVWEMTWVTLLSGAIALIAAIERQSMGCAIAGAIVYLIGMVEGFVPHIVMLGLLTICVPGGFRRNFRYFAPYLVAFVLWMVAWVAWRQIHPSQYEGSSVSAEFSLVRAIRTTLVYGLGGAPFATLVNGVVVANWQTFREGFGIAWLLKAAGVATGFVYFIRAASASHWKLGWKLLLALVVLVFLPLVLVGLTPKYQQWVEAGSRAYVHSHYAYFAWIALMVVLLAALAPRLRSTTALGLMACLGAAGSIVTDWSNYEINLQQHLSARKWETVDMFLKSNIFATIPEGSLVVYRGLDIHRGIAVTDAGYWATYLRDKGGKIVRMNRAEADISYRDATYFVTFIEEPRGPSQYIIVAPLEQSGDPEVPRAKRFSVIANTPNDRFSLTGSGGFSEVSREGNILVNGHVVAAASDNFAIELTISWDANLAERTFDIALPDAVDVRSIRIASERSAFSEDYSRVVSHRQKAELKDSIFASQD